MPANLPREIPSMAAPPKAPAAVRPERALGWLGAVLIFAAFGLPSAWVPPAAAAERAADAESQQYSRGRKRSPPPAETAFGREGDARKAKRVVSIETSDAMRYFPDQIHVKKGHTLRFVVRNAGEMPHELVLGTMDDLKRHAAMMKKGHAMPDDAPNVVHVEPGGTGRLVWHFTKAGEFYYGCLVPGHFEAGMIGTVVVR
jgi:uncharacterized cupredoxin-like copper-binding protein